MLRIFETERLDPRLPAVEFPAQAIGYPLEEVVGLSNTRYVKYRIGSLADQRPLAWVLR